MSAARAGMALAVLLLALTITGAAFGHASLVRSEPADGALLAEPPAVLRLTFNEPVTPLAMRLVLPEGATLAVAAVVENADVVMPASTLGRGTHLLSWRVVSVDGHPVGGSLEFSIGEASASPPPLATGDDYVRGLLWATKTVIYLGLLVGVGGVFVRVWLSTAAPPWLDRGLIGLMAAGFVAAALSVGLQGLDALNLGVTAIAAMPAWQAGFATSYGATAAVAAAALFAGLFALAAAARNAGLTARSLSLAGWIATGLALALSGHASNAAPKLLMRPAVFVHVLCATFWIAALLPLIASLRAGPDGALLRFSRLISVPLALLIASGGALVLVQFDRPDALWTTPYGIVLAFKIAAVAALLALGAANRYVLTPRYRAVEPSAHGRWLARSMGLEFGLAAVVLALVAAWRFTPPPRALAAAEPLIIHMQSERAIANLTLTPVRDRNPRAVVEISDGQRNILTVKELAVVLASPSRGIEPIRRTATRDADGRWRLDGLRVPVSGPWVVRLEMLIDDFQRLVLEDRVHLPRLP